MRIDERTRRLRELRRWGAPYDGLGMIPREDGTFVRWADELAAVLDTEGDRHEQKEKETKEAGTLERREEKSGHRVAEGDRPPRRFWGTHPDRVEMGPEWQTAEGDRPMPASPWDSHGQIRWKVDASPVAPQGIAHEWRFDTIIGHYRCNRCFARDDGSHGPTCPKAILPDPPVQP